jgi:hypothetical protein
LESLVHGPAAKGGHSGKPADTEQGVVDNSYDYGLIVVSDDLAAHDRYQAGEVHAALVDAHAAKWSRMVVHDVEAEV